MDIATEIEALKTVTAALEPLDEDARGRVIDYVVRALNARLTKDAPILAKDVMPDSVKAEKPVGPQEYLRKYRYQSMTRKIGVIAVFLERERGISRVDFAMILKELKDAREPKLPAHIQFARAVKSNFLAKDGDQYYATSAAEALVDAYRADTEQSEG